MAARLCALCLVAYGQTCQGKLHTSHVDSWTLLSSRVLPRWCVLLRERSRTDFRVGIQHQHRRLFFWRMILKPFSLAFAQSSEHSFAEAETGGLSSEYRVSFCMTTTGCLSFCCCAMQVMKVKNSCSIVVPSHDRQFTNLNFDHRSRVDHRSRLVRCFAIFYPHIETMWYLGGKPISRTLRQNMTVVLHL